MLAATSKLWGGGRQGGGWQRGSRGGFRGFRLVSAILWYVHFLSFLPTFGLFSKFWTPVGYIFYYGT